jgi:hypothetical protein
VKLRPTDALVSVGKCRGIGQVEDVGRGEAEDVDRQEREEVRNRAVVHEAEAGLHVRTGSPGPEEQAGLLHHVAEMRDLQVAVRRLVGVPVEQRGRERKRRLLRRDAAQLPAAGAERERVARLAR